MIAENGLVFLYGLLGCIDQFHCQQAALNSRCETVMLDWYKPCQHSVPCDVQAFNGISANVAQQLRALQLDKPVLVGHSIGGSLALNVITNYDYEVGGLVILDTALTPSIEKKRAYHTLGDAILSGGNDKAGVERLLRDTFFMGSPAGPELDELVAQSLQRLDSLWFDALSVAVDQNYLAMLSAMKVPVMYIHRHGLEVEIDRLKQACPKIDIVESQSSSHYLHMFDSVTVNQSIIGFCC